VDTTQSQVPTGPSKFSFQNANWKSILVSVAIPLAVLLVIVLIIFYFAKRTVNNNFVGPTSQVVAPGPTISGTVGINGYIPNGAVVIISERQSGSGSFTPVATITAVDGAAWNWPGATNNTLYDLQATLQQNGQTIGTSSVLSVAAPAGGEILNIVSTAKAPITKGVISGSMDLNGYIPTGSTISILAKKQNENQFKTVASGIYAADGAVWSWANADEGVVYQMQAVLQQNGSTITTSAIQSFSAPAQNEVFTINSTATPPAPAQVGVSGTFNINGTVPSGSAISLNIRQTGTAQFNTVSSGIPAFNNSVWSWNNASAGTSYDIQAVLLSNGTTVASSQILTVVAPAANEILTFNIASAPSAPPANSMTNTCNGNNNGMWQVTFTYNNNNVIPSAQQYQLMVGTSYGGGQIINQTNPPTNPSNPGQAQNFTTGYVFNQGTTYYAQWAYSTCTNCNNWSAYSPALTFYCNPPAPTNTPTPTPTPTNTPIPTPTTVPPTNTPMPTPTNTPAATPTTPPVPTNGLLR
jgi:hypothetical protein